MAIPINMTDTEIFRKKRSLFSVMIVAALIAFFCAPPASILTPALNVASPSVQFERIDGILWRGKISSLIVDDVWLGDVSFKLFPHRVLIGQFAGHVGVTQGALNGEGRFSFNFFTRAMAFKNVRGTFSLDRITKYSMFGIPYEGEISIKVSELRMKRTGCVDADGDLATDALDGALRRFHGEGMVFDGKFSCLGDQLALTLLGENSDAHAMVAISVSPKLNYSLVATVTPKKLSLVPTLETIGFERNGAALVYDAYGPLKGIGP